MQKIGLVVDSTCDINQQRLAELDVELVPLQVLIAGKSYLDGINLHSDEFYEMLVSSDELPKTSQPSPAKFLGAYQKCADRGCDIVICMTMASVLSGTHHSSCLAAADSPIPVINIDTKKVSGGFALVVNEAVRLRAKGEMSGAELAAYLETEVIDKMKMYFILDTMKYIVQGGRAGKAAGLAASLLNIKPILEVSATGEVAPVKKCKGMQKAMNEMAKMTCEYAKEHGAIHYAFLYTTNISRTYELSNLLDNLHIKGIRSGSSYLGPVIGTYGGPNAVGISFFPHKD